MDQERHEQVEQPQKRLFVEVLVSVISIIVLARFAVEDQYSLEGVMRERQAVIIDQALLLEVTTGECLTESLTSTQAFQNVAGEPYTWFDAIFLIHAVQVVELRRALCCVFFFGVVDCPFCRRLLPSATFRRRFHSFLFFFPFARPLEGEFGEGHMVVEEREDSCLKAILVELKYCHLELRGLYKCLQMALHQT